MNEYERRYTAALDELSASGVWDSNAEPPLYRLARKLGFRPRPPYYDPFWKIWIGQALVFVCLWGVIQWLFVWRIEGMDPADALRSAMFMASLYGFVLALSYLLTRKRHSLSRWRDL